MNNTKRNLSIVAIFMAATLVVGTFAVTTTTATTQSAFAYSKNKKGGDENSKNGNTITALKCQNKGSASGFDTATNQECENLICTHPGNNATCTKEGVRSISTPTPEPITTTLRVIKKVVCMTTDPNCSLPDFCNISGAPSSNPQGIKCEDAIGNGVLITLQPGDDFHIGEGIGQPPLFDAFFEGDCGPGTIAAGQHLTCTITNTELSASSEP
jgi:hypothetical protein